MTPKSRRAIGRTGKKLIAAGALSFYAGWAGAVPILLDLESVPVGTVLSAGDALFRHVDKVQHSNPDAFLTTQDDHSGDTTPSVGTVGAVDAFNGSVADAGNPDAIFSGGKTHTIQLSDLFTTTDGAYYVFLFDANQNQSEGDDHIDFSSLKFYTSALGDLKTLQDVALQTLIYDLDSTQDYTLRIDGRVGSGGADMYFYLPTSLAWGATSNYVYLYEEYTNQNDGPDAWNLAPGEYINPTPEPVSLALVGVALAGLVATRRRLQ